MSPSASVGTGKAKSKEEIWLSQIIEKLNDLFVTDELTDKDMINYARTIRDKVKENAKVMDQIKNNSPEQAILGDFSGAMDDAVMESGDVHQNQMAQYLNNAEIAAKFQRVIFDMLVSDRA